MPDGPSAGEETVASTARRRLAVIVTLVVVGVAVAAVLLLLRGDALTGGPVGNDEEFSFGTGKPVGQTIAVGAPTAYNRGDRDAVLERIALADRPAGLEVVGTRVAGPRRGAVPAALVWPADEFRDVHRVKGYRLPPVSTAAGRVGVGLIFILRPTKPGRKTVSAVDVTYRVGGRRHRARIKNGFAICAYPGPQRRYRCKAPTA